MPLREAMPAREMKPTMLATVSDWPVTTSAPTAPIAAIVYGAAITLVQTDLKRMVAYSSISHMGFIVLGISVQNRPPSGRSLHGRPAS
jgi:NADH:ubiquinone oxidoreductase subunit 4 (subunit M)